MVIGFEAADRAGSQHDLVEGDANGVGVDILIRGTGKGERVLNQQGGLAIRNLIQR